MKKSIIWGIVYYIGFSLLELFSTHWDFDFYREFSPYRIIMTLVLMFFVYLRNRKRYESSGTAEKSESIKKMELVQVDYDIREVIFDITDYNSNWFDYDVFHRGLYGVSVGFHADDFDGTGIAADFSASKNAYEKFMNGERENYFYIELAHHGIGHGHDAPENQALEDCLAAFCRNKNYGLSGIYDCTYQIKDYKSLTALCGELEHLSRGVKITKSVSCKKECAEDFAAKISSMPGIPVELKQYFSHDFVKTIFDIKTKQDELTRDARTEFKSGLVIKNCGTPIFLLDVYTDTLNMEIL